MAALLWGAGCQDHPLKSVEYGLGRPPCGAPDPGPPLPTKLVDILFVIDNSGSMADEQEILAANFGRFVDMLEAPGVQANYRIGVTTTDNGNPWCAGTTPEGGALRATSCRGRLDEFVFAGTDPPEDKQTTCTEVCDLKNIPIIPTRTDRDPWPKPRPWIESLEGVTNLPQGVTATEAFQCFGPQGINGCGFESHLESMYKALRRSEAPDEASFGFLRRDAVLAVVFVTDEVDCSHQNKWSDMFMPEGNRVFWADPEAEFPTSAVCWNAGVACTGGPGVYEECHAENYDIEGMPEATDDAAVLHPVQRYTKFLRDLEHSKQLFDPTKKVLVTVLGGVPEGYATGEELIYDEGTDLAFFDENGIGPGCSSPGGKATPPVRLRELAEHFEEDGQRNVYSVCGPDYIPALEAIAEAVTEQIRPACFYGCAADGNPSTRELDANCKLTERGFDNGGWTHLDVPECVLLCDDRPCSPENHHQARAWTWPEDTNVCYRKRTDRGEPATASRLDDMHQTCIDAGFNLEFVLERRAGVLLAAGTEVTATCELSPDPAVDCPDL